MSHFDSHGVLRCVCGQAHRLGTHTAIVSATALEESAQLLGRRHGAKTLWVLSDENTEEAAGHQWKSLVAGPRLITKVLPGSPRVHPTDELVDRLAANVKEARPDLLVSVGSGVLSDLVKRLSLVLNLPNWCIATAPSVDAYSSGTAAITVKGFHGSMPARASETIVCDLRVMEKAPRDMLLSGLGDLLAKYLAFLDWNLSRIVTGESYCSFCADAALQSARSALLAAQRLDGEPAEAARTLTDAALSSGFAMQALEGSRSAASAEHTIAHFWESAHCVRHERWNLHGILVGAASRITLHACRALYSRLERFTPDEPARLSAFEAERPWQETLEPGLLPFLNRLTQEMRERSSSAADLSRRIASWYRSRTALRELSSRMLEELSAAVESLAKIGFPFSLMELGIEREEAMLPMRNVRLLRRRYSSFDLAYDLGLEKVMRDAGAAQMVKS